MPDVEAPSPASAVVRHGSGGERPVARAFGPLPRHHLHDIVYGQIARLIDRGEFPRGTRLPGEVELAERFGVSRPIVRRALSMLRDACYLATRKGSGTVVIKETVKSQLALPRLRGVEELRQLYEYRLSIEGRMAALAAERRTEADLALMEESIARSESALHAGKSRLVSDLNFSFHRAVAVASANRFFVSTLEAMPNLVGETPANRAFGTAVGDTARQWRLVDEHRAVLEAVRLREPERAGSVMLEHIERAMRDIHGIIPGAEPK